MRNTLSLISIIIVALLFTPSVLTASAHVPFGVYAGTHAVSFVPNPGSPLLGEKVKMTFFLRDLHGEFPTEPFKVEVVVQEVFSDDSERNVATLLPTLKSLGIYTTEYRFRQAGQYRVEFLFNKVGEPDLVRDAVFDINIRDVGSLGFSYSLTSVMLLIVAALAFWGGRMSVRRDSDEDTKTDGT